MWALSSPWSSPSWDAPPRALLLYHLPVGFNLQGADMFPTRGLRLPVRARAGWRARQEGTGA